jgi:hypothetical protein
MSTTQELKDQLKDAFLETAGLGTMNHEEFCLFVNMFFNGWSGEVVTLCTQQQKMDAVQESWLKGYDAGWEEARENHAM